MNDIYKYIEQNVECGKKMLAVLLDPEKCVGDSLAKTLAELGKTRPDFIFIGGSTKTQTSDTLLTALGEMNIPKVLFPGDATQFSLKADALLLLSLVSGDNSDYLIGQHKRAAMLIKKSNVEVIPTAYVLIDGGRESSVQRVSKTTPIPHDNICEAISTSVAGELLGMKLVYLEAGSGALQSVSAEMISTVKNNLDIPLIVGGGICTEEQLKIAYESGADLVVVGNLFETDPKKISSFISFVKKINEENNIM